MLGGSLRGEELHQVQQLTEAAGFNHKAVNRREDLPLLSGMAGVHPATTPLRTERQRHPDPRGNMAKGGTLRVPPIFERPARAISLRH